MTDLFIELYLDEDVSALLATLIRSRGFSATTAREEGRLGYNDDEQLAYATEHNKAILTHNRNDFVALANEYYAQERTHCGIIIARRHSTYKLLSLVTAILDQVTADEFQNQVRYI
jgi:predicted nuclease of predicted toxin-antitoxin system